MTTWNKIIQKEKEKGYYKLLNEFIQKRYKETKVYPPKDKIFLAFELTSYENLKVVILGQDPYHQPKQAQGLAFSTPSELKNPPSMVNILKEVHSDIGNSLCDDGDLTPWAKQGVLLINTVLTVEDSSANSHKKKGWETFTDNIIKYISENNKDVIFILWGAPAIKKTKIIDETKHHILTSPHPSPLSSYRGFFGCQHFSKSNAILKSLGKKEIQW
ncbi:uracil-DNA glycosylase [Arcobacteraceae bacterium]|nr:uracil-DNA glycosylase [Arcobacteraceae bacterium]